MLKNNFIISRTDKSGIVEYYTDTNEHIQSPWQADKEKAFVFDDREKALKEWNFWSDYLKSDLNYVRISVHKLGKP